MNIRDQYFKVHGQTVAMSEARGAEKLYMLPILELSPGCLYADDNIKSEKWCGILINGLIGLIFLSGGILFVFAAFGFFPDRESGWNIGLIASVLLITGIWFIYDTIWIYQRFTRLRIKDRYAVLEHVFRTHTKSIGEVELCNDDYLSCYISEDAYQDIYSVGVELVLTKLDTSISLWLNGITLEPAPGKSADESFYDGLNTTVQKAFEKAKEIGECLDIRIYY